MCEDQNVNPTVDDFSTMRNLGGRTTWVVTVDYPGQRKILKLLTTRLGQSSSFSFFSVRRFDSGYYGKESDIYGKNMETD